MNKEKKQHIANLIHDCLIDNIEPCENEEPITGYEFEEFMEILKEWVENESS